MEHLVPRAGTKIWSTFLDDGLGMDKFRLVRDLDSCECRDDLQFILLTVLFASYPDLIRLPVYIEEIAFARHVWSCFDAHLEGPSKMEVESRNEDFDDSFIL